jgi:hypothetical protein
MAKHRIMTPDGNKADGVIVKKPVSKTSEQKIKEELKAKADAKPAAKKTPAKKAGKK